MFLTIFFSLASSALTPQAQDQPGWPCMGNVDPVYIRSAEATGGKVSLFKRSEMAKGAAAVIAGSQGHEQIVVRAGGELDEGAYEFDVPIDSTIESVHFFVSMQCLQYASHHRQSAEALRLEDTDVEHHAFEAVRLFTVKTPAPGGWKVRVAGGKLLTLVVTAMSRLALSGVTFSEDGTRLRTGPGMGNRSGSRRPCAGRRTMWRSTSSRVAGWSCSRSSSNSTRKKTQ